MVLANIYAPNVDDPAFFGLFERKLHDMGNYPVIAGGDFNLVMDGVLDRSPPSPRPLRSVGVLRGICRDGGLVDIWRLFNPSTKDYSFFSPPHGSFSRLDFFLISNSVVSSAMYCTIGNIVISDHAPIFLRMLPFNKTARSFRWRLNSSLLLDTDFRESLRGQIVLYKDTNLPTAPSAGIAWEAMKAFIRGYLIQHASFIKRSRSAKQLELEGKVDVAEKLFKQDASSANLTTLTRLKFELNSILTQKAEFNLFRARQKYFEEGDKAGRLLARYIKQKENQSSISAWECLNFRSHTNK